MNQLAWRLTTDFNKEKHLFTDTLTLDYFVETYICNCGYTKFILKYRDQEIDYKCAKCENMRFYNANLAWSNFAYFIEQELDTEFEYEYKVEYTDNVVSSFYGIRIPTKIDFMSQKIIYDMKAVYTVTLTQEGELHRDYILQPPKKDKTQVEENLLYHINNLNPFDIPKHPKKRITFDIAAFFLKNRKLKDFEFYYWEYIPKIDQKELFVNDALIHLANYPKEKSIKKALYHNYTQQMDQYGKFNAIAIEVFCKTMNDTNIIVKLLNLESTFLIDSGLNTQEFYQLMIFLKKYYTEKQLFKLFSSQEFENKPFLFRDILREFITMQESLEHLFKKVACKAVALHDEFVRCGVEERYKYMFTKTLLYKAKEIKPCITLGRYKVRVPQTGMELFKWAESLHNCMAGYFDAIDCGETIIYCFFKDDDLQFAVEVSDGYIIQASGKYNREILKEEEEILEKWFQISFTKIQEQADAA